MIASVSGVRGVLNQDMSLGSLSDFTANFARLTGSDEFLVARDTRSTGIVIGRTVAGALLSRGATVIDFGVISTPALFRESRMRRKPAVMVTASHNEPEFNGLKFVVDGFGISQDSFDRLVETPPLQKDPFPVGKLKAKTRARYNDDLVGRFGEPTCEGMKVALDIGGGAAIYHASPILTRLGCAVSSVNDAPGVFSRKIDPMAGELPLLQKMVKAKGCAIGLGFDCDGDRLAIVDNGGNKRTGDFMLTLAISQLLADAEDKRVVVSVDTTQAVDDVVTQLGGEVFRSSVGEANVVGLMRAKGVKLGGEGSSGGLIDGSFNYCRDSMLAALTIIRALKNRGPRLYDSVRSYHQSRVAFQIPRKKAVRAIKTLAARNKEADLTDGVKLRLPGKSWVLIRPSGTEDVVRVSAESGTKAEAKRIAEAFAKKLKELSR